MCSLATCFGYFPRYAQLERQAVDVVPGCKANVIQYTLLCKMPTEGHCLSDLYSEHESGLQQRVTSRVLKCNTGPVVECGGSLKPGAWRGCNKSAW